MTSTREQIVASAAGLFWRRGFHHTSVDLIVQDAGVCKGNFYHYFPSKDALGLAVIDAWAGEYERHLFGTDFGAPRPPLERLEGFIDAIVEAQKDMAFVGCPLARMALEMGDLDESFRQRIDHVFRIFRGKLEAVLAEAGVEEASNFSRYLLATIQGGFLLAKVERDRGVLYAISRQLKRQLRHQLMERVA
ncbi:MAG: TetR/AcrR family transcriptional regulator [Acidobacteriota bacterium]